MRDQHARNRLDTAFQDRQDLTIEQGHLQDDIKSLRAALGAAYKYVGRPTPFFYEPDNVDTRLTRLEQKLDALMKHLDVHTKVPEAAAPYVIEDGAAGDDS